MPRARPLAVVVLLLSYGAVGARQPAVRSSVQLPAPADVLAQTLGLPVAHRDRIVLDVVRLIFDTPDGADPQDSGLRSQLNALLASSPPGETAPLPLDPSIWRESILRRDVPDARLLNAILADRRTALLYHGLAALDDETLGWIGPERDLLAYLLERPGAFAATAPSLKVRGGRVVVPGGVEADEIWSRVMGASPLEPVDFVRRLYRRSNGRLALFYDTVAQLDGPRQRLALAFDQPGSSRVDRVRALVRVFERSIPEDQVELRPFGRQSVDPALTLSVLEVEPGGALAGPTSRRLWEAVYALDDGISPQFAPMPPESMPGGGDDGAQVDAAWLTAQILERGALIARRRLDAFLFAQRVFRRPDRTATADVVTALRGVLAFPALMLTLERCGVGSPGMLAAAARRADALNSIGRDSLRQTATRLFQASLGIIDRSVVKGGLKPKSAEALVSSLLAIDVTGEEALRNHASWLRRDLLPAMSSAGGQQSAEDAVLSALAGTTNMVDKLPVVEWEGHKYRVSPEIGELARLRRVRARQGGPSLDDVLGEHPGTGQSARPAVDEARARGIADVLASILYAAHVGQPDSRIMAADNVALRHALTLHDGPRARPADAWLFAVDEFRAVDGWQLRGSLLGLDVALGKYALRTIDLTTMPPAPRLTSTERQTAGMTAAFMHSIRLSDEGRDEIAAAIKRGRARLAELRSSGEGIERLAEEAGLSGWRREGLRWTLEQEPDRVDSQLSLLELMWLGAPRAAGAALDGWGAAALPLTGCLCLQMPRRAPWEFFAGRPSVGLFASRGADVALLIAEHLAELRLPAALAPGVLAFAMKDAIDAAQPGYFDDWSEFGRAAQSIPRERLLDYLAALTAGGPLLPAETDNGKGP